MHHPTIRQLRQSVFDFTKKVVIPNSKGRVLEVGCDYPGGSPYPELYINLREELESRGLTYLSADSDPRVPADITCDFFDIRSHIEFESFDTVIMLEVLEHMWEVWRVPFIVKDILKDGGLLFLSTPFYFMEHDPKPDYWRLTGEGLRKLFMYDFDVHIERFPAEGNFPLHHTMIGRKK